MSPRKVRKRPRQERSRATVEAMIEAVGQALGKLGFRRATTTRIADRAGVSVGSLYQYFPGKEALLAAFFEKRLEQETKTMMRFLEEGAELEPAAFLRLGVEELLRVFREDRELYRRMYGEVPNFEELPEVKEGLRNVVGVCTGYLRMHSQELDGRDPELVALASFHALRGALRAIVLEAPEKLDDPQLAKILGDLVLAAAGLDPSE